MRREAVSRVDHWSSPRVSAPGGGRRRRREFLADRPPLRGGQSAHSGGTAPESHRLPPLPSQFADIRPCAPAARTAPRHLTDRKARATLSDMESSDLDRDAAVAQLAALRADRAALADRVLQPWWYDVLLGLLLFGFLASYAFDSLWVTFPALVLFGAGLGALVGVYRRLTGVWVSARGRVMWVWSGLAVLVLV